MDQKDYGKMVLQKMAEEGARDIAIHDEAWRRHRETRDRRQPNTEQDLERALGFDPHGAMH
jgi:hypothetical protein